MIRELVQRVEQTLNRSLQTHGDFMRLSDALFERTRERVSPTTLRRLWGYGNESVKPSRFTLDTLARFLLFRDYADFCSNAENEVLQSGLCLGGKTEADSLYEGQVLRMSWLPDRCCLIKYLGNGGFRIVEAHNTKLSVGDTFTCHLFINNEPAYLDNLMHNGQGPMRYVAGRKTGVLVEKAEEARCGGGKLAFKNLRTVAS